MTKTTITSNVHKTFDVHLDFCTKRTFYLVIVINLVTDFLNLLLVKILDFDCTINFGSFTDLHCSCTTDTKDIGQSYVCSFSTWEIHTCYSCHVFLPLTLFVLGVFTADNAHYTAALYNLTVFTNSLYR
jgi:hypothetical protein